MTTLDDFRAALVQGFEAAAGDSNDAEIDAWRRAAEIAAELLGVNFESIEDDAYNAQCGDYPAPCNCDDPTTHNGHNARPA